MLVVIFSFSGSSPPHCAPFPVPFAPLTGLSRSPSSSPLLDIFCDDLTCFGFFLILHREFPFIFFFVISTRMILFVFRRDAV